MPSDKDRLYVALYVRGGAPTMPKMEDMYDFVNNHPLPMISNGHKCPRMFYAPSNFEIRH